MLKTLCNDINVKEQSRNALTKKLIIIKKQYYDELKSAMMRKFGMHWSKA